MAYSREFILAKVADIGLVSFYFMSFTITASILLQLLTSVYDKYTASPDGTEKSTLRLFLEVVANIFFIAVTFWVARNIIERVPFPLDGLGGYQHSRLSTQTMSQISALAIILFQTALMEKIKVLNERIFVKSQGRKED
jgi:hypothetical protein